MNFQELKNNIAEYVYTEDDGMIKIAMASIIATRLKIGDPVWMIIIGPSSSGKSQVLRPLALTDEKFIHRVDDMTENTLLSGMRVKKGEKDISLLKRIGPLGMIVISDFTVIFSKNSESKNAILGQLRMVYDGQMTKYSGTSPEPITWKGALGILAGSTPSIYTHFEDVADMGERFIYYKMKDYDVEKAVRLSLGRKMYGKDLDEKLSGFYKDYIKESVTNYLDNKSDKLELTEVVHERILKISMIAALLRTPTHYDKYSKTIDRVPVSEMPMRVALQLSAIAKGLMIMQFKDNGNFDLSEEDIKHVEWCAYSLANEERRACLKILASIEYTKFLNTQTIADKIGLSTSVIGMVLQHLSAIGILERIGDNSGLNWRINKIEVWRVVRRMENIEEHEEIENRDMSVEDGNDENVTNKNMLDEF